MQTITVPLFLWTALFLVCLVVHPGRTPWHCRALNSLLLATALLLAVGAVCGSTANGTFTAGVPGLQNASRLGTAASILHGYKVYYMPNEGPVLSSVYPPIAYLFYLPVAAPWLPITFQVMAGSFLSLAFCALPVVLIIRRHSKEPISPSLGWAMLSMFLLCCFFFRSLYYSTASIHADAPALGFGALSVLCLYRKDSPPARSDLWLAALTCALSVWAKQPMVLLPVILVVLEFALHGRASGLRFALYTFIVMVLFAIVFSIWFGPRPLMLHLVQIKMHHPWWNAVYPSDLNDRFGGTHALRGKLKAALTSFDLFLPERWLLLALAFAVPLCFFLRFGPPSSGRIPLSAIYFTVAVVLIPIAIITRAQIGGAKNSYSFFDYFAIIACVSFILEVRTGVIWTANPSAPPSPFPAQAAYAFSIVICLVLIASLNFQLVRTRRYLGFVTDNPLKESEDFLRTHPGVAYFPANPLAHLDVEGIFYHEPAGFAEKYLAYGESVFAGAGAFLPKNITYLALPDNRETYSPDDLPARFFPEYTHKVSLPGMQYWKIYTADTQSAASTPVIPN
jgi:hypothetical protein